MSFTASSGGDFELCPAAMHNAIFLQYVELGTIEVGGQFPGQKSMIRVTWEVDEKMDDGRPFLVFARYTKTFGEKSNFRKMVEGFIGRKFEEGEVFEPSTLVGKPCMVNVVHSPDGKWANVAGVTPLPKGMPPLKPQNELLYFSFDDPDFMDSFTQLSARLQESISLTPEFKGEKPKPKKEPTRPMRADFDDDLDEAFGKTS